MKLDLRWVIAADKLLNKNDFINLKEIINNPLIKGNKTLRENKDYKDFYHSLQTNISKFSIEEDDTFSTNNKQEKWKLFVKQKGSNSYKKSIFFDVEFEKIKKENPSSTIESIKYLKDLSISKVDNKKRESKQYYFFNNEEHYLDKDNAIVKKRNKIPEILKEYLNIEKDGSKNIYTIEGKNIYFKKMGPDQKNEHHWKEEYQLKRINILRVIKEQLKEKDIDLIVGVYYLGNKVVFGIIDAKYYYQDKRKEFMVKFKLEDIINSVDVEYTRVKNIDKTNKDENIVFTNDKNFKSIIKRINDFSNTLSFHDVEKELKDYIDTSFKENNLTEYEKNVFIKEVKSRNPILQSRFRSSLIEETKRYNHNDMINVIKLYENEKIRNSLVVASHIKDFSNSTKKESQDIDNGLLLPTFIDAFFDKKLLSFNSDGTSILSKELYNFINEEEIRYLKNIKINKEYLNENRIKYLDWHRKKLI